MTPRLQDRWRSVCENNGLDAHDGWLSLLQGYAEPPRAYHDLKHIEDCLLRFDEHAHLAADTAAVEFAIWFHDIVYDTHTKDSEERSAEVAADYLSGTQFETSVVDLILATKHDELPRTGDAALLCDVDLSILGRTPDEYDIYSRSIREEYSWVPLAEYVTGRSNVLKEFLMRPSIFTLAGMRTVYESLARDNLKRELCTLEGMALSIPTDIPARSR